MSSSLELQQKGLIQAFELESFDIDEADDSLIGFFGALQKIEERLMREGKIKQEVEYG